MLLLPKLNRTKEPSIVHSESFLKARDLRIGEMFLQVRFDVYARVRACVYPKSFIPISQELLQQK